MGSLDEINKKGILAPVFFLFDSAEMSSEGQAVLTKNAETMKQFPTWIVSIEGHCDERGTAEYNLALGERRALAVRQYLVSLGIAAERLRTVSYGKEFPFDPGHGESVVGAQPPRQLRRHRQVGCTRHEVRDASRILLRPPRPDVARRRRAGRRRGRARRRAPTKSTSR